MRVQSDWHNVLKLGYDVEDLSTLLAYECDVVQQDYARHGAGGTGAGRWLRQGVSKMLTLGINTECLVTAGATDSIAAFYAASCTDVGEAVTSLSSTMVLKMLSEVPVRDNSRGIYSHRLGQGKWLVGSASNVGCAVLRQENFSGEELAALSAEIDPSARVNLDYYSGWTGGALLSATRKVRPGAGRRLAASTCRHSAGHE